jgi:peptidyl-prolyl cis-trans isomerase B (cyclophilin B)
VNDTNDASPVVERPSSANTTPAIIGAVVAVVVMIGVVWALVAMRDSPETPSTAGAPAATQPAEPSAQATPPASPAAAGDCVWAPADMPGTKEVGTPPTDPPDSGTATMVVTTNQGVIEVSMDRAKAPCTVASFTHLASKGYFDKTVCHRLTTEGIYVLQCGDPAGNGTGGPGYQFADENLQAQADGVYERGVVAMANAGPGTNGSQFFFNYKDGQLAPNYTSFGVVTKGMDVLDKIAAAGHDGSGGPGDGRPKNPVEIQTVTVS